MHNPSPSPGLTPLKTRGSPEDAKCARPKCLCLKQAQSVKAEATFVVERFVGQAKKVIAGRGVKMEYLIKWLG
jgi:hypothetical protein